MTADDARQVKLAKNEALFRSVNERAKTIWEHYGPSGRFSAVCECADPACSGHVDLAAEAYEAVRASGTRFLVLPDHVSPDAERTAEEHDGYVVIEKFEVGARVAAALDERRRISDTDQ